MSPRAGDFEPAFIETDFTVPLLDVSSPSSSGLFVTKRHHHNHNHHHRETKPSLSSQSSSRPSPLAAASPSAAVSPALPLLSPGVIVSPGTPPILSATPVASVPSSSSNRNKLLTVPTPQLQRPADGSRGAVNVTDEFGRAVDRKYVVMTSGLSQPSNVAMGPTTIVSDRAKMIVKSVRKIASMNSHQSGLERDDRGVVTSLKSEAIGDGVIAHGSQVLNSSRRQSVNGVRPAGSVIVTASEASKTPYHHRQGQHQPQIDGRDDVALTYERHRLADALRQRSLLVKQSTAHMSNPHRQQVVDRPSMDVKVFPVHNTASGSTMSILSPSSLSGGCVIQQRPQRSESSSRGTITGSVLRPALMRMVAANPEVSRAFRSTVEPNSGASTSSGSATSRKIPPARPSANAVASAASHYRPIQPKPTGMVAGTPVLGGGQYLKLGQAKSASPMVVKCSTSNQFGLSILVPDRSPTELGVGGRPLHPASSLTPYLPMSNVRRATVVSAPLSSPLSVLSVPRLPAAAHVSPKTTAPSLSPHHPPYLHHAAIVSPPPPAPSHCSPSALASGTAPSSAAAPSAISSVTVVRSRSAHQMVSPLPSYGVDSFDQVPLDCSRKNVAPDSAPHVDYVLNLTTSGSQSKLDVHQSEVIDLSGSGAQTASREVSQRRQLEDRRPGQSTQVESCKLEHSTVAKKSFDGQRRNGEERGKTAPVAGLTRPRDGNVAINSEQLVSLVDKVKDVSSMSTAANRQIVDVPSSAVSSMSMGAAKTKKEVDANGNVERRASDFLRTVSTVDDANCSDATEEFHGSPAGW